MAKPRKTSSTGIKSRAIARDGGILTLDPPAAAPAAPPAAPEPEAPGAAELRQLEQQIAAATPPPPPPPPPAEPAPTGAAEDEVVEGIEGLVEHPELLDDLSEDDLADVCELAFGLVADWRGPEWEMPASSKPARRFAHLGKRVLERHPGLPDWLKRYIPELVLGVVVLIEVRRRWVAEQTRRAAEKKEPAV